MMTLNVKFHDPVITKDGHLLGNAQRIYTKVDPDRVETQTVDAHLKVFDFETGDVYFIPMDYLVESASDGVSLSIDHDTVLERSYSRMPRYVAYELMTLTELAR